MKKYAISVNGTEYDVTVEEINPEEQHMINKKTPDVSPKKETPKRNEKNAEGTPVKAPIPGTVVAVRVSVGAKVTLGQPLVVVEAMKMENDIVSPKDGVVSSILIKKGDAVNSNDTLVYIV